jgi:hypothetical protein
MSTHKLFLFTKDTDASATERGFHYQKLKTLKTWLENRINEVDDIIYCDYEDDIFERNIKEGKALFRQVKLYSSNFSFSKEEIQKSLAHFFMLFVKGDYMFDKVSFSFETNSGIAKEIKGNDGNLLKEWWENQDAMSDGLIARCRARVKVIIDGYINEVYQTKMSPEGKAELDEAKDIYDNLTDDVWDKFIQAVKWQFDGIEPEDAIPLLLTEAEALVKQLPLPIDPEKASTYISVLHFEIAQRTAESEESKKTLSNELIDALLLKEGSEKNKWYADIYEKWHDVNEIRHFNVGAFYEVVSAARHCRWEVASEKHRSLWLKLLKLYIYHPETIIVCKRKAIYEYLFLLTSPDPKTFVPKGSIAGEQELARYYFQEFEHRNSVADIEEDITLLEIIQTHQLLDENIFKQGFLEKEEIGQWSKKIEAALDQGIKKPLNTDELCLYYELKGTFLFHSHPLMPITEKMSSSIEAYRLIIPLLENAKTYSISRLSDQLNQKLSLLIKLGKDENAIETLELFLTDIEEHAAKTGIQHNAAHSQVERGIAYLSKPSPKNYLKALDCFHKAKSLWFINETSEGYTLAMINIAQVYNALGMNLAAKYYGLCGVWAAIHFGNQATFKRISDSYAIVFHSDFKQGAWISALDDYQQYIKARIEFKPDELNMDDDEIFRKTLLDLACILSATPKLHPAMSAFIEFQKSSMAWLYTDYLKVLCEGLEEKIKDDKIFGDVLQSKLTGIPLNDVGHERTISFKASGIEWRIVFKNTAILNAISEEFCSLLQIVLCEIGLLGTDLHLLQMPVTIHVTQGNDYESRISQRPSHGESAWDVSIPFFNLKEREEILFHYAYVSANIKILLSHLSVLPTYDFNATYDQLYLKQKLAEKALAINSYQKVYFHLLDEERFDQAKRQDFLPIAPDQIKLNQSNFLALFDKISERYNRDQFLKRIDARYINLHKLLSVSLVKWNEQTEFHEIIGQLRNAGWLDWQILLAIMNYVVSVKAERYTETVQEQDPDKRKQLADAEFRRQLGLEEKDCYVEIPASWLRTPLFKFFMEKMPVDTLESFGLENGMKHPNFKAVHSLLNKKFNFNLDDNPDNNPLKDI